MENSNTAKIIKVTYFINNDSEEKILSIEIEKDINFLSYELITNKFFYSLKDLITKETDEDNPTFDEINSVDLQYDNIIFDYIRYLENDCWIFLGPKDIISLIDLDNPELMIKVTIISKEKIKIKQMYDKTAEKINKIRNEIEDLSKDQYKVNKNDICKNNNMDLVVLTANPLMDGEKELRTMNDFNKIPCSIYEAIKDSINLLNVEFSPLTMEKFEEVLSNEEYKPTILHLIFKSTYRLPENIPEKICSDDFVNIVFEKDDYNVEFINKESLRNLIQKNENIKKNIKDINLIISTQLAGDVSEMFKEFEFKNVLIQHTTITDIDYISKFNFIFYTDLISSESQYIQDLFQDGLNCYNPECGNIFCCCFHSHGKIKDKCCEFMTNYKNELYNDKESIEENNIDDMYKTIPHFCHLQINEHYKDDFCIVRKLFCDKYKRKIEKIKEKGIKGSYYNICCCQKKGHNINEIFFKKFVDSNENYLLGFGGKKKSKRKKYIPDFSKMNLLVGKNKIIYEVINFIKKQDNFNINIFSTEKDCTTYDLNELANVMIEYIKERTEEYEPENDELEIIGKNYSSEVNQNSQRLNLIASKTEPLLIKKHKEKTSYLIFDLNSSDCNIFDDYDYWKKQNAVYFIIINDKVQEKLINEWKAKINKLVIFSLKKFDKNQIAFNLTEEIKSLNKYNKYVKGQLKEVENALFKK